MAFLVQKFGGATLDSVEKINGVAARVAEQKKRGDSLVVVVSAMGKTTDALMELAQRVSENAVAREVDVLLSTGEMVSMALLSMALNARGCSAISLCGFQAGIRTDRRFLEASVLEVEGVHIRQALADGHVVIVAGFQGQSIAGELTTLGRGGSDTTALALAASLGADRCEILKELPAIYSADPRLVDHARPLSRVSYDQLLDMTFWGAKVLQYRSVEIAKHFHIPLYVGPARAYECGTLIKDTRMVEDTEMIALNSHETVLQIKTPANSLTEALRWLNGLLAEGSLPFPQLLHCTPCPKGFELMLTGPRELLSVLSDLCPIGSAARELSSVTATCRGSTRPETSTHIINSLEAHGIPVGQLQISPMSITVFVDQTQRLATLERLHRMIPESPPIPHLVTNR